MLLLPTAHSKDPFRAGSQNPSLIHSLEEHPPFSTNITPIINENNTYLKQTRNIDLTHFLPSYTQLIIKTTSIYNWTHDLNSKISNSKQFQSYVAFKLSHLNANPKVWMWYWIKLECGHKIGLTNLHYRHKIDRQHSWKYSLRLLLPKIGSQSSKTRWVWNSSITYYLNQKICSAPIAVVFPLSSMDVDRCAPLTRFLCPQRQQLVTTMPLQCKT